jgi:hypothetical protein
MEAHLDNEHRATVEKIFGHPASGNIEWRQVVSLLEAIGTVTAHHTGKLTVALGPEIEFMSPPHGKDIDVQMVVDLRRMLRSAGFEPGGGARTRERGVSGE